MLVVGMVVKVVDANFIVPPRPEWKALAICATELTAGGLGLFNRLCGGLCWAFGS